MEIPTLLINSQFSDIESETKTPIDPMASFSTSRMGNEQGAETTSPGVSSLENTFRPPQSPAGQASSPVPISFDSLKLQEDMFSIENLESPKGNSSIPTANTSIPTPYPSTPAASAPFASNPATATISYDHTVNSFSSINIARNPIANFSQHGLVGNSQINQSNLFVNTDFGQSRRRSTSDVTNNASIYIPPVVTGNVAELARGHSFDATYPNLLPGQQMLHAQVAYDNLFGVTSPTASPVQELPSPTSVSGGLIGSPVNLELMFPTFPHEATGPVRRLSANTSLSVPAYGGNDGMNVKGTGRRKSNNRSRSVSPNPESRENEIQHPCPVPGCGKTFNRRGNMVRTVANLSSI